MFDRFERGERALLVQLRLDPAAGEAAHAADDGGEFEALARSAGVRVVGVVHGSRSRPDPRWFAGAGKVDEIAAQVAERGAEVVLFDHALSPSQERNLERRLRCRVLDRTGLILDIFAQRARSFEGKLQVELAQLRHLSTRLVRGWTHLERQKGGIGLRGPGEKQLETDRRLLAERIRVIRQRLARVDRQREQGRQARRKAELPTVSLVGYTNAGKSSLFNALSGAGVYAADQLFATLDPTLRRIRLPNRQTVVLADTVGFIRQLPHELVAAFRATLQATAEADLLLHVIDASDPRRDEYREQVERVLAQLGAADKPCLLVYNKIDRSGGEPRVARSGDGRVTRVWVSAHSGAGLDLLREEIARQVGGETVQGWLTLPLSAGRLRAELFAQGAVLDETVTADGRWVLQVRLARPLLQRLAGRHDIALRPTPA